MATELHFDPVLAEVVQSVRHRAEKMGELSWGTFAPIGSALPSDAQEAVTSWLDNGGYDEAIARIGVEDPDLANQ